MNILISFLTLPFLLMLMGGKVLADVLLSFGQASEEVFRGDRLPVLHLSTQADPNSRDSNS